MLILGIVLLLFWIFTENKSSEDSKPLKKLVNPNANDLPDPMNLPSHSVQAGVDTFWTRVVNMDGEPSKIYHYQLPDNFIINPKYLMFHPNFNISPSRTVQIISENEGEAVAMLNLWISLNQGLLDDETQFSTLFKTSIERAKNHPSVVHKFKQDIINMLYYQPPKPNSNDNLEFTEDLALSEIVQENPPARLQQQTQENHLPPRPQLNEGTENSSQQSEGNFQPMAQGSGGGAFAPF